MAKIALIESQGPVLRSIIPVFSAGYASGCQSGNATSVCPVTGVSMVLTRSRQPSQFRRESPLDGSSDGGSTTNNRRHERPSRFSYRPAGIS
jgi:hypothetical protein